MTCKDAMTADPSFCLPSDSVGIAAQIMKREDVGPVLVVSDRSEKRLMGIVTDRDLAIKVLAEGRDAHSCRVDEVMSSNPVTCNEDEDVRHAIRKMSEHQIRRIPVVDEQNRLRGIIAQADVARMADEEQVGAMVEDISQPYGMADWAGVGGMIPSRNTLSSLALGAICLGAGIGLMYLLDPNSGSDRRTSLRRRLPGSSTETGAAQTGDWEY
ncbi:MAG TPA: CBS domain-containing protein [Bryobacteraceae bacterium]|nr:CBS domain-containing protein [Bryobacteraceae bacterium]